MMTGNLKQGYKGIIAVVLKGAMAVCGFIPSFRKEAKGYVHFLGARKRNQKNIHLTKPSLYGRMRIRGRFSDPLLSTFRNSVYDSVWNSGEPGKLSETCSKVEAGEYNLAA